MTTLFISVPVCGRAADKNDSDTARVPLNLMFMFDNRGVPQRIGVRAVDFPLRISKGRTDYSLSVLAAPSDKEENSTVGGIVTGSYHIGGAVYLNYAVGIKGYNPATNKLFSDDNKLLFGYGVTFKL